MINFGNYFGVGKKSPVEQQHLVYRRNDTLNKHKQSNLLNTSKWFNINHYGKPLFIYACS